jgi:hypothetical protein
MLQAEMMAKLMCGTWQDLKRFVELCYVKEWWRTRSSHVEIAALSHGKIGELTLGESLQKEWGDSHSSGVLPIMWWLVHLEMMASSRVGIGYSGLWDPLANWAMDLRNWALFFFFSFIIHMCIQGLVHFSPLPPPPPLPPTPPPPSPPTPSIPSRNYFALFLILL